MLLEQEPMMLPDTAGENLHQLSPRADGLTSAQGKYRGKTDGRAAPTIVNSLVRTREYLTGREVERLMAAARKGSRWGHRDATMILIGYRHGLRASELCDLQWSQVELRAVSGPMRNSR